MNEEHDLEFSGNSHPHLQRPLSQSENLPLIPLAHSNGSSLDPMSKSSDFRHLWVLQSLSEMSLDMNRCYKLLEQIKIAENQDMHEVLNTVIQRYFEEENQQNDETSPDLGQTILRSTKSRLFPERPIAILEYSEAPNPDNSHNNLDSEDFFPKKNCLICCEDQSISKFPDNYTVFPHDFCLQCLKDYFKQKIDNNEVLTVPCPDQCGLFYEDSQISEILNDPPLFQKYLRFRKIAIFSHNPNVRWCVRPDCPGYIEKKGDTDLLICPQCSQEVCFLCGNAWHGDISCENAISSELRSYIQGREVKGCPNCKAKIEKNNGCNHMTCGRCRYQFCWICGRKYTRLHYYYFNLLGCPGLQYKEKPWGRLFCLYKFLIFLGFCLVWLFKLLIVVPFLIVLMGFLLPMQFIYKNIKPNHESRVWNSLAIIVSVIMGVILFPICFFWGLKEVIGFIVSGIRGEN